MSNAAVFQHIKQHGQACDTEISSALGLSLSVVQASIQGLSLKGEISCCSVTRYDNGKAVRETLCRVSGYTPPAPRGRKPNAK